MGENKDGSDGEDTDGDVTLLVGVKGGEVACDVLLFVFDVHHLYHHLQRDKDTKIVQRGVGGKRRDLEELVKVDLVVAVLVDFAHHVRHLLLCRLLACETMT